MERGGLRRDWLAAFAADGLAAFAAGAGLKDHGLVHQARFSEGLPDGRSAFDEKARDAARGKRAQHIADVETIGAGGGGDHLRARGFERRTLLRVSAFGADDPERMLARGFQQA